MEPLVYIIEDNWMYANHYADDVQIANGKSKLFETGKEALEALATTPPDLILLDWQLADDIDGGVILQYVRDKYPWVPVVSISGWDSKYVQGVDKHIGKQAKFGTVIELIEHYFH